MFKINFYILKFNYLSIGNTNFLLFILITLFITILLLSLAYLLSNLRKPTLLKKTEGFETYEFGTNSIGNSSLNTINKHFYILGILFIVFDIELMFLFPWIYNYNTINYNSKDLLIIFIILLILGFIYEINSGALNWYNPPSFIIKNRFNLTHNNLFFYIGNTLKKRKNIYLLYLNINIFLLIKTLFIISNWDLFLFNSKLQFNCYGLTQSLLSITNNFINYNSWLGVDYFSLLLIITTLILIILSILSNWNSDLMHSSYLFLLLIFWIEIMVLISFSSIDLFIFFISFEGITLPTFFLIYLYGSELTKVRASLMFLLCSLTSSTFITISLISLYSQFKSSNIYILNFFFFNTQNQLFSNNPISIERFLVLWIVLFLGFAFKMPLCPFHMWLPEAHAEAPTAGSIILAGSILKLGGYGIFRFFLPLFNSFTFYIPIVYTCCLLGILYASLSCIRTSHIKQIIAYSSVTHMGTATLGLVSGYTNSILGSLYSFLQHSFISSGLFIIAGILYERYEIYEINHLQGLNQTMPLFSVILILFMLINLPFPIFGTFIGEFCLLLSIWKSNLIILFIFIINEFLCALYSIWFVHRLIFTGLNINFSLKLKIIKYIDLTYKELFIVITIILIIFVTGIYPNLIFNLLKV